VARWKALLGEGEMAFRSRGAAAILWVASATAALGQTSPPAEPQPPVLMPGGEAWSGFYVGANAGFTFGNSNVTVSPAGCIATGSCANAANNPLRTFSSTLNGSGFAGGAQAGYNWRMSPLFLLGAEADIDYDGLRGHYNANSTLPAPLMGSAARSVSQSQDFLGTVRGRAGFLVNEGWLVYATGGLAYGQAKSATTASFSSIGDSYAGSTSGFRTGWTAGAGLEWMLGPFWSVKAEYLYVDMGSTSYTDPITNAAAVGATGLSPQPAYQTRFSNNQNIVRVGVNYHFGTPPEPPPAPPVVGVPAPPPAAPKVFIVFFDWDKDMVSPEAAQVIQQAADAYRSGAPVQLQVTGYTDRSGSPGYNQRLSERRAANVAKALAALGVPREEMAVSGRGENDNRVPTADGVREPQNRRVEIVTP
jgi:outer membrane immunogenic protein